MAAQSAADAYLGLICDEAFDPDVPKSIDEKSYMKQRSDCAISRLIGGGFLPGSLRSMYPIEGFEGVTFVNVDPSLWQQMTGQNPLHDRPLWPGSQAESGRLISLKSCAGSS